MKKISKKEIDTLIDKSLHLLKSKKYTIVSVPFFQRKLMVDEREAAIVFEELQKLQLINNVRMNPDTGVFICDVDINVLRQLMLN